MLKIFWYTGSKIDKCFVLRWNNNVFIMKNRKQNPKRTKEWFALRFSRVIPASSINKIEFRPRWAYLRPSVWVFVPVWVLWAEWMVLFSFISTLCPLVSFWWLLLIIAAVDEFRVLVWRRFLHQQPLQHLFVRPLPSEVVLIDLELQEGT